MEYLPFLIASVLAVLLVFAILLGFADFKTRKVKRIVAEGQNEELRLMAEQQLEELRRDANDLHNQCVEHVATIDALSTQVKELQKLLEDSGAQLSETKSKLAQTNLEMASIQAKHYQDMAEAGYTQRVERVTERQLDAAGKLVTTFRDRVLWVKGI